MEDTVQTPTQTTPRLVTTVEEPQPFSPPIIENPSKKKLPVGLLSVMLIMLVVTAVLAFKLLASTNQGATSTPETFVPVQTPQASPISEAEGTVSTASGNTNPQLDIDQQTIDKSLGKLDSDLSNVNAGLNDKSINLSE